MILLAGQDTAMLDGRFDIWIRGIQVLTLGGMVGVVLAAVESHGLWRDPRAGWPSRIWSVLFLFAGLFLCWLLVDTHTLGLALDY